MKDFTKIEIRPACYSYYNPHGLSYMMETASTFTRIDLKRTFIKILITCDSKEPVYVRKVFPRSEHPLQHQLRDMCRAGLVDRYHREGSRGYYYKTTDKGKLLIAMAKAKSEEKEND